MKKIKATRSFFKKALPRQQRKKYPLKTLTTSEFLNCLFSVKAIDSSIQLSIWFYKICFLRMVVLILRWPNFKTSGRNVKEQLHLVRSLFSLCRGEILVYMFLYYHFNTNKEYTIHVMQRKRFEVLPFSLSLKQYTIIHKIFQTNSSFLPNSVLQEKFNFCFVLQEFLLVLTLLFWLEGWGLGYYSITF